MTDEPTIEIREKACTRCHGDVSFAPPCSCPACNGARIGACPRCRLVVIEPVETPRAWILADYDREVQIAKRAEAVDSPTAEALRHMLEHADTVIAGNL